MTKNQMIDNKYNIPIEKEELYFGVYRYTVPEGYFFESYGNNYGSTIYGSDKLENHYVIRKKNEEN